MNSGMTDEPDASRHWASRLFSHPATLLALAALFTGLLVPWVTNRWEERDRKVEASRAATEREIAVKAALVSKIGTASADFLSALELGDLSDPQLSATQFRALRGASLEIASQLAAYFPQSRPEDRWRNYTYSLRNAYQLLQAKPGKDRNTWVHRLNRYFGLAPATINGLCFETKSPYFAPDIRELVLRFQRKEEEVVRAITDSPSKLTGTPTPDDPQASDRGEFVATARLPCTKNLRG